MAKACNTPPKKKKKKKTCKKEIEKKKKRNLRYRDREGGKKNIQHRYRPPPVPLPDLDNRNCKHIERENLPPSNYWNQHRYIFLFFFFISFFFLQIWVCNVTFYWVFLLYRFRFDFGFDSILFRVFEFSMKFSLGSNMYRIEYYIDIYFFFFNLIFGFFCRNHMHVEI